MRQEFQDAQASIVGLIAIAKDGARRPAPGSPERPLSPSQVLKYLDCSAAWHFKYVANLTDPANANLALGRAMASATAATLRAKMDGEQLAAGMVVAEILSPELARELAAAELDPAKDDPGEIKATAGRVYEEWHRSVLPILNPAAVEVAVSGEIAGVAVRGFVDMVDQDGTVVDLKTAAKAPSELEADEIDESIVQLAGMPTTGISHSHAFQLATYGHLLNAQLMRIDMVTKAKKPRYISQTARIGEAERRHVEEVFPIVADAMAQGFAIPNRSSMFCSKRGCAFWRACQTEFGGRVKG